MKTKDIIRNGRLKELDIRSEIWRKRGVEIFIIEAYQYRFVKNGKEIDYFPISGKYHEVKANKWGSVPAYDFYKLFDAQ